MTASVVNDRSVVHGYMTGFSIAGFIVLAGALVLQPAAVLVLDADGAGRRPKVRELLLGPFTNPLTVGTLVGLALAVTGWRLPEVVAAPVGLIGAMAVPGVLLAYGISLRLGPGFGGDVPRGELALTSTLKLVVQPLVAWAVAHHVLGIDGNTQYNDQSGRPQYLLPQGARVISELV